MWRGLKIIIQFEDRGVGDGWAEWAFTQPGFGRSVTPISTRGADCAPNITTLPTQLYVASYAPGREKRAGGAFLWLQARVKSGFNWLCQLSLGDDKAVKANLSRMIASQ